MTRDEQIEASLARAEQSLVTRTVADLATVLQSVQMELSAQRNG